MWQTMRVVRVSAYHDLAFGRPAPGRDRKGSGGNNLTFSGVEAPVWQGARNAPTAALIDVTSNDVTINAAGRDASALENASSR